jgi:hypothetical protein
MTTISETTQDLGWPALKAKLISHPSSVGLSNVDADALLESNFTWTALG